MRFARSSHGPRSSPSSVRRSSTCTDRPGRRCPRWRVSRRRSRTSSRRTASGPRAVHASWRATSRRTTRRRGRASPGAGRCSSGRRTATSSRWGPRTRTRRSVPPGHRGTSPWRRAGGAGGGRAAAGAAGEVVWALGTDTGGSVRQPAALSGVVGLKPTYGLISRYGLIAFASSLDTVGTLTRSVRDAATLLSVLGGKDPRDATSLDGDAVDYTEGLDEGVRALRVGVIAEASGEGVEAGVRDAVGRAVDRLAALGAEVGEAHLPHAEYALSAYYL